MNTKKAIKKIVALGLGATMLGATLFGAAAANLEDFPSQFITADGEFDGLFVVGAEAAAADIVGITAIAQTVQAKAIKQTWHDLDASETSFSSEDGDFLVDANDALYATAGVYTPDTVDEDDFADLLADGVVFEETDDDEYDYEQSVSFEDIEVIFGDHTGDYDDPITYLSWGSDEIFTYTVHFNDILDVTALGDGEKIELLGQEFTFEQDLASTDDLVLYKSSQEETLQPGVQVTIGDKVVELIAIDNDNKEVTLKVNGQTETVDEGDSETFGGLEIRVDKISANTIGDEFGFVKVFIGSDELLIEDGENIQLNDETLYGVSVDFGGDLSAVENIIFTFTPDDYEFDGDDSNQVEILEVGEATVDPLFGVLSYQFVKSEAAEDDTLAFNGGGDEVEFEFTNVEGESETLMLLQEDGTGTQTLELYDDDYSIHASVFDATETLDLLGEDDVFILAEDMGDEDEVSSFYTIDRIKRVDGEAVVVIENMLSGDSEEFEVEDEIWDTGVYVGGINVDDEEVNITESNFSTLETGLNYVVTNGQLKVTFDTDGTDYTATLEELDTDKYDDSDLAVFTGEEIAFDANTDDEVTIKPADSSASSPWESGDNDMDYFMAESGTEGTWESGDDTYVEFVTYKKAIEYNVLFGPTDASANAESGADGYYTTEVVAIPAERSVLDTEVTGAMSENLIVVGGPCANSVASALMGSPADCAAGFNPGEAIIKLFDETDGMAAGKVALLVAGYSAEDTRAASAAVAGMSEDLTGKEAVLTTSIQTVTETETVEETDMEEPVDAE